MPVLTLIRTSPDFPPGSMPAYAGMVSQALAGEGGAHLQVRVCDFFDPSGGGSMRSHHFWRLCHAHRLFAEHPSDLYHLLDGSMAGLLPAAVLKKTVVTVHDLIPLLQLCGRLPGHPGLAGRWLIHRTRQALKQAAGLAAVSAHTAADLKEFTGRSDVSVIRNPVRPLPAPDDSLELPSHYLFHVGNNADYKNRTGVLDVFSCLQDSPDLCLIMAGPEPSPELKQSASRLERVRFTVNPSDAQLFGLYKKASAFLFPSLYEGFGMPVLEAMAAGCPVVCSAAASLPEVAGDAALMASATDPEALANHCRALLNNQALRDDFVLRGLHRVELFTVERLGGELRALYAECFNRIGVSS